MTRLQRRGQWIQWRGDAYTGAAGAVRADHILAIDHPEATNGIYVYLGNNSYYLTDVTIEEFMAYVGPYESDQIDIISEQANYIAKLESELEELRAQVNASEDAA